MKMTRAFALTLLLVSMAIFPNLDGQVGSRRSFPRANEESEFFHYSTERLGAPAG